MIHRRNGIPLRLEKFTLAVLAVVLLSACGGAPAAPASPAVTPAVPSAAPAVRPTETPFIPFDTAPVAVGDTASSLDPSWVRGPFMLIFVRAYKDSNGDGDGDLEGLIQSLDYLQDLGIRGIWLLGIFRNWDHDHGYMVTDYRNIDPNYGTFETLERLLAEAHRRGIGIILDYATNMSAATHPGFVMAANDPASPWRDWYVFSVYHPSGWPVGLWQTDSWRFSPHGWYYAFFDVNLPEFNWRNPAVAAYHQNTFRFWLNLGVDGFRLDSASFLVENGPGGIASQTETWAELAGLRAVVDAYDNRFMVCEGGMPEYAIAEICGGAFNFDRTTIRGASGEEVGVQYAALAARGDAAATAHLAEYPGLHPIGKISVILQNHDVWWGDRLWDQFGGDTPSYRLAAATYLTMPGIPFIYYGEEIGLADMDNAGQSGSVPQRGPMSWTGDPNNAGFTDAPVIVAPKDGLYQYFRVAPNVTEYNVASERQDPDSLLNFYTALIALRNAHPALSGGGYRLLAVNGASFVFERTHAGESIVVAVNYSLSPKSAALKWLAPGRYEPLFAYRTDPAALTAGQGGSAVIAIPAQSAQVFRLARSSTPFGVDMFVRGSMNDWGTPDLARFVYRGSNLYAAELFLPKGTHAFKIAGFYWEGGFGAVNWRGVRTILPGVPFIMETTAWDKNNGGDVLYFEAPVEGRYTFNIDATNVLAPILTIRKAG